MVCFCAAGSSAPFARRPSANFSLQWSRASLLRLATILIRAEAICATCVAFTATDQMGTRSPHCAYRRVVQRDRKSVGQGNSWTVRVDLGGSRGIKKKKIEI